MFAGGSARIKLAYEPDFSSESAGAIIVLQTSAGEVSALALGFALSHPLAKGDALTGAKSIAEVALDGLENILKLVQMSSEAEASLRSKLRAVKTHGDEELTRKAEALEAYFKPAERLLRFSKKPKGIERE